MSLHYSQILLRAGLVRADGPVPSTSPAGEARDRPDPAPGPAARGEGDGWRALLVGLALLGDATAWTGGMALAHWLRYAPGSPVSDGPRVALGEFHGILGLGTAVLVLLLAYQGAYRPRKILRFRRVAPLLISAGLSWLALFIAVAVMLRVTPELSRLYVLLAGLVGTAALGAWRFGLARTLAATPLPAVLRRPLLVVGWTEVCDHLTAALERDPAVDFRVVGCLPDPSGRLERTPPPEVPVLGAYPDLPRLLARRTADTVLLASLEASPEDTLELVSLCEREMVHFKVIPSIFKALLSGLHLETIQRVPVLGFGRLPLESPVRRALKRGFDVAGAAVGLVLTAPFMAIFAWRVWREERGPVLYRQTRTGRRGRPFAILKIRSMRLDAERAGPGWSVPGDPRCLEVGRFMRRHWIDELPQLWNVLRGDMSLVGPRPERPELIQHFQTHIPHYNLRHIIPPGLTGWAQVNGFRGDTDLAGRISHDLYYIEHWDFWFDCYILLKTAALWVRGDRR